MKKTIFDFKLMKEGMRQIKSVAIACLVFQLIIFVLVVLVQGADYAESTSNIGFIAQSATSLMPLLPLVCIIWAPLLCLTLFSFLNSRSASDIYHALPQSRRCLFFSFLAAIGSWLFIIFFTVVLLTGLGTLLFPTVFNINWGEFLLYGILLWVSAFYVSAATCFAMSISGNPFTGVLLTVLLLFGPRLVFMSLADLATYAVSVYDTQYLPFPFHPNINVVSSLTQLFMNSVKVEAWFRAESILFTLGLGILFTLLAAHCFQKRKSENAGQLLPSGKASLLIPLAIGLIPCMITLRQLFLWIIKQVRVDSSFISTTLGSLLLSLALYLAFVWFGSRKISVLKKSLPGLLLLPLFLLLSLGAMTLIRNNILQYRPASEELSYVRILNTDIDKTEYPGYFKFAWNSRSYRAYDSIRLGDPAVLASVSQALTDTLDGKKDPKTNYQSLTVAMKSKGIERVRTIQITEEKKNQLVDSLRHSEAYRQKIQTLPEVDTAGLHLTGLFSRSREDYRALQNLYACLREDVSAMDPDSWLEILNWRNDSGLDTISFSYTRNGISEGMELPISFLMPRTVALYFQEISARQNRDDILQQARDFLNRPGNTELQISLDVMDKDEKWRDTYIIITDPEAWPNHYFVSENNLRTPDQGRDLLDMLQKFENPDPGKVLIKVELYRSVLADESSYDDTYWSSDWFWCSVDTLPAYLLDRKAAREFKENCNIITTVLESAMYNEYEMPESIAEVNELIRKFWWGEEDISLEGLQGMPAGAVYTYEDGVFSASYTDASGQLHHYEYTYGTAIDEESRKFY